MKLTVTHVGTRPTKTLDTWVEQQIFSLGDDLQIDNATVRIAYLRDANPAYQVQIYLVTPGPDVFAEGQDHTLGAAFNKAMKQLRDKITFRTQKRAARIKSNLSAPAALSRGGYMLN